MKVNPTLFSIVVATLAAIGTIIWTATPGKSTSQVVVGETYSRYPDPWCRNIRYRVLAVAPELDYVHVLAWYDGRWANKSEAEEGNRWTRQFERDPHNCINLPIPDAYAK